ncbi:hypothetical protein Stsp02_34190 [Streptomyces sp. NBRC 14336]|nr:hypothetical protein Stsp02_34190 [Streptomyces sp. NBRC 14336]
MGERAKAEGQAPEGRGELREQPPHTRTRQHKGTPHPGGRSGEPPEGGGGAAPTRHHPLAGPFEAANTARDGVRSSFNQLEADHQGCKGLQLSVPSGRSAPFRTPRGAG